MKVIAKYSIAYCGTAYNKGDEIDMKEEDYPRYQGDVDVAKKKEAKAKTSNKKLKTKGKTKKA